MYNVLVELISTWFQTLSHDLNAVLRSPSNQFTHWATIFQPEPYFTTCHFCRWKPLADSTHVEILSSVMNFIALSTILHIDLLFNLIPEGRAAYHAQYCEV